MPVLNGALSLQKFTNARYKANEVVSPFEDTDYVMTSGFEMSPGLTPEELVGLIITLTEDTDTSIGCIISAQYHEDYPDEVIKFRFLPTSPYVMYYSNKTGKVVMMPGNIPDILGTT